MPLVIYNPLNSANQSAEVTQLERGPWRVRYQINLELPVLTSLSDDRQRRSDRRISLPIASTVTLYAGQPGIFITTQLNNQTRDYKLSVHFPADLQPEHSYVDGHF